MFLLKLFQTFETMIFNKIKVFAGGMFVSTVADSKSNELEYRPESVKDKFKIMPAIRILLLLVGLTSSCSSSSQNIKGNFPDYAHQEIILTGFEGFENYTISTTIADAEGRFSLSYSEDYRGMGYIAAADKKAYFVVLSGEDISLKGGSLADPNSVECTTGKEQQVFIQYATEHPRREQALSAWGYLERMYAADPLFSGQEKALASIAQEKARIKLEDQKFLDELDPNSYTHWFLPMRRLVSSVSTVAQYRTEEIPETIEAFRQIDHTDARLYHSGLYKDAIESHYWLLENMGQNLDKVFMEMNKSTDRLLDNIQSDEKKFNEITDYLFDLLERHSLFEASEYLAIKALTQGSCTVNEDLAKQLETYRAMKKGNTAPDIAFSGERLINGSVTDGPAKLSDLDATHKLIVFGASWCPKCTEEIPRIARLYSKWKQHGVEVVFVSLDELPSEFRSFAKTLPFISYCDFKKWDSPIAKDYYVFSTPTMFLLDGQHEILLRPNSVQQVDAWVDWYLAEKRQ
jgi:thiol-disulfide isomerase/thioredoxin